MSEFVTAASCMVVAVAMASCLNAHSHLISGLNFIKPVSTKLC